MSIGSDGMRADQNLGMIVDCSHVSPEYARQVLELTRAPVMFSHSNAQAVYDCARNVPDDVLEIQRSIQAWSDDADSKVNLIVTSGGTGFAVKDRTPEVSLGSLT